MHQQVYNIQEFIFWHTVFMCFVFMSGQIATFAPIQHKLIGFYNGHVKCLLRGTDWVLKYNRLRFAFKGLN